MLVVARSGGPAVAAAGARPPADAGALVARAAAGDAAAWDRLVSDFERLIWSIARAHRLNESDAADVAQTTWLRLYEHLGTLQAPDRIGAWLATTARRECLRVLRAHRREVPSTHEEVWPDEADDQDIEARVLEREDDQRLWDAFSRLPGRQQALLRLLAADPAPSYAEIGAALDMPIGSIGPTRARALERLRRELAAAEASPQPKAAVAHSAARGPRSSARTTTQAHRAQRRCWLSSPRPVPVPHKTRLQPAPLCPQVARAAAVS